MLSLPQPTQLILPHYQCRPRWEKPYAYFPFQGQKYVGVTTILRATQSPEQIERLAQWQQRVGTAEAEAVRRAGGQRGKRLHRAIQTYWTHGRDTPMELQHHPWEYWDSIEPVLAEIDHAPLLEGFVWHPAGFGGVVDALVSYQGELCVCDWKTSAKPKKWSWIEDHCLQVAAYTAAVNRVYQPQGLAVRRGLVVVVLPDREAQVFELESDLLMEYWRKFQTRYAQFQYQVG